MTSFFFVLILTCLFFNFSEAFSKQDDEINDRCEKGTYRKRCFGYSGKKVDHHNSRCCRKHESCQYVQGREKSTNKLVVEKRCLTDALVCNRKLGYFCPSTKPNVTSCLDLSLYRKKCAKKEPTQCDHFDTLRLCDVLFGEERGNFQCYECRNTQKSSGVKISSNTLKESEANTTEGNTTNAKTTEVTTIKLNITITLNKTTPETTKPIKTKPPRAQNRTKTFALEFAKICEDERKSKCCDADGHLVSRIEELCDASDQYKVIRQWINLFYKEKEEQEKFEENNKKKGTAEKEKEEEKGKDKLEITEHIAYRLEKERQRFEKEDRCEKQTYRIKCYGLTEGAGGSSGSQVTRCCRRNDLCVISPGRSTFTGVFMQRASCVSKETWCNRHGGFYCPNEKQNTDDCISLYHYKSMCKLGKPTNCHQFDSLGLCPVFFGKKRNHVECYSCNSKNESRKVPTKLIHVDQICGDQESAQTCCSSDGSYIDYRALCSSLRQHTLLLSYNRLGIYQAMYENMKNLRVHMSRQNVDETASLNKFMRSSVFVSGAVLFGSLFVVFVFFYWLFVSSDLVFSNSEPNKNQKEYANVPATSDLTEASMSDVLQKL